MYSQTTPNSLRYAYGLPKAPFGLGFLPEVARNVPYPTRFAYGLSGDEVPVDLYVGQGTAHGGQKKKGAFGTGGASGIGSGKGSGDTMVFTGGETVITESVEDLTPFALPPLPPTDQSAPPPGVIPISSKADKRIGDRTDMFLRPIPDWVEPGMSPSGPPPTLDPMAPPAPDPKIPTAVLALLALFLSGVV